MDRRAFLRSAGALSLGGLLLGPQVLELWDRLTWKRTLFPGWSAGDGSVVFTREQWEAMLDFNYVKGSIAEAINIATPFRDKLMIDYHRTLAEPWNVFLKERDDVC